MAEDVVDQAARAEKAERELADLRAQKQDEIHQAYSRPIARQNAANAKIAAARAKYPDFDEKLSSYNSSPAMCDFYIDHPDGMEIAYALADRPADVARILQQDTISMQIAELAYIARELAGWYYRPCADKLQ